MGRLLFALGLSLLCCLPLRSEPGKTEKPKPLPEATAKAWRGIGTRIGWLGPTILDPSPTYGALYYSDDLRKAMDPARTVPVVMVEYGRTDFTKLAKVPSPETPFGIWVHEFHLKDDDFSVLARFENLKTLQLTNLRPNDGGDFGWVRKLDNVTHLKAFATPVGDAGLKEFAGMKRLAALEIHVLRNAGITAAGWKHLADAKTLRELHVVFGQLNEDDYKAIATLTNLERLELHDINVTDAGLRHLAALKNLKTLVLSHAEVTDKGVEAFQAALPKCEVYPRRTKRD